MPAAAVPTPTGERHMNKKTLIGIAVATLIAGPAKAEEIVL